MKRHFFLAALSSLAFLGAATQVAAQDFDFVRRIQPFPVTIPAGKNPEKNIVSPFLGGFNQPRPQFLDIDGDGDLDLFLQEQRNTLDKAGQLMFFENSGTPSEYAFDWVNDWYKNIDIGTWYKFVDFDFDGDFDLFTESPFSRIRIYENIGAQSNASFMLLADSLRDADGAEIVFDLNSAPELADIDCDGDVDLFLGNSANGTITFYENLGANENSVPQFEFVTNRFEDISIIGNLGAVHPFPDRASINLGGRYFPLRDGVLAEQTLFWTALGETPSVSELGFSEQLSRHGASSFLFADIDNDADLDLFWGDLFEPSLIFLQNSGACSNTEISMTLKEYPPPSPLFSSGFNMPRFADIDADGDLDLFVGILGGIFSQAHNLAENFYFYKNFGTKEAPAFSLVEQQFISTLDIGANSIPVFVDIDDDGDLDLFLANEEDPSESLQSHLYLFENQGAPDSPAFRLADDDVVDFDLGTNLAPSFVDIDDDSDLDLFIGEWDGKLDFLENTGTATSPEFISLIENFGDIDVGNFNTPAFVDIDDDGDQDMFIGTFLGKLEFFRNDGAATMPVFAEPDRDYFGIDVGLHCYPVFIDIDKDEDQDLILGSDDAGLFFYRNAGSKQEANFVLDAPFNIHVLDRSTPGFVDIDDDGDLDFFAGGKRGGLIFYENREVVTSIDSGQIYPNIPDKFVLQQNYPNPFNPETTLSYEIPVKSRVKIVIYNLRGQAVLTLVDATRAPGVYSVKWNGRNATGQLLPSGLYLYRIKAGDFVAARRMLLLK
ncbi:MAG: T9SS type A sorting domain-containing protein [bacterium]